LFSLAGRETAMARSSTPSDDPRDASLRISKHMRDSLKAAAAVMSRPLYDVTNEAVEIPRRARAARSECNAASRWPTPKLSRLTYYPVPKAVGSPKNDSPNLVEPQT
jgi:hypothetical protein